MCPCGVGGGVSTQSFCFDCWRSIFSFTFSYHSLKQLPDTLLDYNTIRSDSFFLLHMNGIDDINQFYDKVQRKKWKRFMHFISLFVSCSVSLLKRRNFVNNMDGNRLSFQEVLLLYRYFDEEESKKNIKDFFKIREYLKRHKRKELGMIRISRNYMKTLTKYRMEETIERENQKTPRKRNRKRKRTKNKQSE